VVVSIITVVFNNVSTIENAIISVLSQDYPEIEYIIIDGGSDDGTQQVINKYIDNIDLFYSESDSGIYDAINKGIKKSKGEVIGLMHSDDIFIDSYVVSDSVSRMKATNSEFCFSDMAIVNKGKIMRYYRSSYFHPWLFKTGWMPAHPTSFIKRKVLAEFGYYSLNYKIAGDFDFFVKMFSSRKISWCYLNRITVIMNHGGVSNSGLESKRLIASEISQSLRRNQVFSLKIFQLFRYFIRFMEFILKPRKGIRKKILDSCKYEKNI
jgi:glycosyltransferase involved in cell wall biosynthesis